MNGRPSQGGGASGGEHAQTAWVALAAVGGFGVLLAVFGVMAVRSLPSTTGVDRTLANIAGKADKVATDQSVVGREMARLSEEIRADRALRAQEEGDLALLRTKVNQIDAALREQAEKPRDPMENALLRARLDELQSRIDALAQRTTPQPTTPQPSAPARADATPVTPGPVRTHTAPGVLNHTFTDIEREVMEMRAVIHNARTARSAVPVRTSAPPPRPTPVRTRPPERASIPSTPLRYDGPLISINAGKPALSMLPAQQPTAPVASIQPAATEPEPRLSSVGVNSAQNAVGWIGWPFDAIGNLFAAIGEGLDRLFTGREYLPRDGTPVQARR